MDRYDLTQLNRGVLYYMYVPNKSCHGHVTVRKVFKRAVIFCIVWSMKKSELPEIIMYKYFRLVGAKTQLYVSSLFEFEEVLI